MAPAPVRGLLQCLLKLVNFVLAITGVMMVFYSFMVLNEWWKNAESSDSPPSADDNMVASASHAAINVAKQLTVVSLSNVHLRFGDTTVELPAPWFIYAFLGAGIVICIVTFAGAVATEIHSKFCLSFYQFGIAFMLVVQILVASYLFFDRSWDKEIPDDPTGELRKMKKFVEKNIGILKWFGLGVLIVQIIAIILAMSLHAVQKKSDEHDRHGDEEVAVRRLREPLLPADAPPGQYIIDRPAEDHSKKSKRNQ